VPARSGGGPVFAAWPHAQVHVEWGVTGARQAAERGDAVVIVDVLSFSTEVVMAAADNLTCLVYSDAEVEAMGGIDAAAAALGARPHWRFAHAGPARAEAGAAGAGQRVLFRSANGAAVTRAAGPAPEVLIGCLRNARACAGRLERLLAAAAARRATIIACGATAGQERRFRPALEDWLAAGRIAACLAGRGLVLSPEAHAAALAWPGRGMLASCAAASAMTEAGLGEAVEMALAIDSTDAVPARLASAPDGHVFALFTHHQR
jgi:2-phosphosulfolactate phosphatase